MMGLRLASYFKQENKLDPIIIVSLLTDESYVSGVNQLNYTGNRLNFSWFNTANILSYVIWVTSSI
nr:hypothetical protein [Vagococcus vulneris]